MGLLAAYKRTRGPSGWLGAKVGSRLALSCIHQVNRVNSHNDDGTINIIIVSIIITYASNIVVTQVCWFVGSLVR